MRDEFERQLALLNEELTKMGGLIESAIANAVKALEGDEHYVNKAYDYENAIDDKEREIESLCLKLLLTQQPVASDLRLISAALKMITDMERIGDQAEDIAEIAATAKKKILKKSKHIQHMATATIDMVDKSVEAFIKKDLLIVEDVARNDDIIDTLFEEIVNDIVELLKNKEGTSEILDMLMVAKYFERIGDHAVNIAEWVQFSITGEHKRL